MKTAELTGAALDWAVWVAAGGAAAYPKTANGAAFLKAWKGNSAKYLHPSTDWAQGGPIVEREGIELKRGLVTPFVWAAFAFRAPQAHMCGPTPLIAACRCFVASKLGDEVDIPKELT